MTSGGIDGEAGYVRLDEDAEEFESVTAGVAFVRAPVACQDGEAHEMLLGRELPRRMREVMEGDAARCRGRAVFDGRAIHLTGGDADEVIIEMRRVVAVRRYEPSPVVALLHRRRRRREVFLFEISDDENGERLVTAIGSVVAAGSAELAVYPHLRFSNTFRSMFGGGNQVGGRLRNPFRRSRTCDDGAGSYHRFSEYSPSPERLRRKKPTEDRHRSSMPDPTTED